MINHEADYDRGSMHSAGSYFPFNLSEISSDRYTKQDPEIFFQPTLPDNTADNESVNRHFVNYTPERDVDKRTFLMRFVFTQAIISYVKDLPKKPVLPFAENKNSQQKLRAFCDSLNYS